MARVPRSQVIPRFLWMNCAYERGQPPSNANNLPCSVDTVWIAEKLEINNRGTLRSIRGGSKNTFIAGNGHHPGATQGRGRSRETGASRGCLAPAGGLRRRAAR
jgi:hypothetical protein